MSGIQALRNLLRSDSSKKKREEPSSLSGSTKRCSSGGIPRAPAVDDGSVTGRDSHCNESVASLNHQVVLDGGCANIPSDPEQHRYSSSASSITNSRMNTNPNNSTTGSPPYRRVISEDNSPSVSLVRGSSVTLANMPPQSDSRYGESPTTVKCGSTEDDIVHVDNNSSSNSNNNSSNRPSLLRRTTPPQQTQLKDDPSLMEVTTRERRGALRTASDASNNSSIVTKHAPSERVGTPNATCPPSILKKTSNVGDVVRVASESLRHIHTPIRVTLSPRPESETDEKEVRFILPSGAAILQQAGSSTGVTSTAAPAPDTSSQNQQQQSSEPAFSRSVSTSDSGSSGGVLGLFKKLLRKNRKGDNNTITNEDSISSNSKSNNKIEQEQEQPSIVSVSPESSPQIRPSVSPEMPFVSPPSSVSAMHEATAPTSEEPTRVSSDRSASPLQQPTASDTTNQMPHREDSTRTVNSSCSMLSENSVSNLAQFQQGGYYMSNFMSSAGFKISPDIRGSDMAEHRRSVSNTNPLHSLTDYSQYNSERPDPSSGYTGEFYVPEPPSDMMESFHRNDSFIDPVAFSNRLVKQPVTKDHKVLNGKYVLYKRELIGTGSFGKVKLCYSFPDKTFFAVKIMNKKQLSKMGIGAERPMERLLNEITIMMKLRHENIIALREVIDDEGTDKIYLILELAEYGSLMSMSEGFAEADSEGNNKITETAVQRMVYSMVNALAYAHQSGVAHRDIKPENILLTSDWTVKIGDFGVSCLVSEKKSGVAREGSIAFLPPEMLLPLTKDNYIAQSPFHAATHFDDDDEVAAYRAGLVSPGGGLISPGASRRLSSKSHPRMAPLSIDDDTNSALPESLRARQLVSPPPRAIDESNDRPFDEDMRTDSVYSSGGRGKVTVAFNTRNLEQPERPPPAAIKLAMTSMSRSNSTRPDFTILSPLNSVSNLDYSSGDIRSPDSPIRRSISTNPCGWVQVNRNEIDLFKADVWALGVTVFVMLHGHLPWLAHLPSINGRLLVSERQERFAPTDDKDSSMDEENKITAHMDPRSRGRLKRYHKWRKKQRQGFAMASISARGESIIEKTEEKEEDAIGEAFTYCSPKMARNNATDWGSSDGARSGIKRTSESYSPRSPMSPLGFAQEPPYITSNRSITSSPNCRNSFQPFPCTTPSGQLLSSGNLLSNCSSTDMHVLAKGRSVSELNVENKIDRQNTERAMWGYWRTLIKKSQILEQTSVTSGVEKQLFAILTNPDPVSMMHPNHVTKTLDGMLNTTLFDDYMAPCASQSPRENLNSPTSPVDETAAADEWSLFSSVCEDSHTDEECSETNFVPLASTSNQHSASAHDPEPTATTTIETPGVIQVPAIADDELPGGGMSTTTVPPSRANHQFPPTLSYESVTGAEVSYYPGSKTMSLSTNTVGPDTNRILHGKPKDELSGNASFNVATEKDETPVPMLTSFKRPSEEQQQSSLEPFSAIPLNAYQEMISKRERTERRRERQRNEVNRTKRYLQQRAREIDHVSDEKHTYDCCTKCSSLALSFIQDALMLDPMHRPSMAELLMHPWLEPIRKKAQADRNKPQTMNADIFADIPLNQSFNEGTPIQQAEQPQEQKPQSRPSNQVQTTTSDSKKNATQERPCREQNTVRDIKPDEVRRLPSENKRYFLSTRITFNQLNVGKPSAADDSIVHEILKPRESMRRWPLQYDDNNDVINNSNVNNNSTDTNGSSLGGLLTSPVQYDPLRMATKGAFYSPGKGSVQRRHVSLSPAAAHHHNELVLGSSIAALASSISYKKDISPGLTVTTTRARANSLPDHLPAHVLDMSGSFSGPRSPVGEGPLRRRTEIESATVKIPQQMQSLGELYHTASNGSQNGEEAPPKEKTPEAPKKASSHLTVDSEK